MGLAHGGPAGPGQQKSCQISVDSGENVSRRLSDWGCSSSHAKEQMQLVGNKLSKVVDVLPVRTPELTLANDRDPYLDMKCCPFQQMSKNSN